MKCYFCSSNNLKDVRRDESVEPNSYLCPRCGHVYIQGLETHKLVPGNVFNKEQKRIISICIRNKYERRGRKRFVKPLTIEDLDQIIKEYRPLDPLDKLDNALSNLKKASKHVGNPVRVNLDNDFPYYHCINSSELLSVLQLLRDDRFIKEEKRTGQDVLCIILTKGYGRLREIERHRKDSRKCFVAMWFADEMNEAYEKAIKEAIEYKEEGETKPRFEAVRIDKIHHTNDINEETIARIRRSRFMVADLTGYRGGVYFEAGFAYGLGMKVIYTCREDWGETMDLYDTAGNKVEELYDKDGRKIEIKKQGVHFDLAGRKQIRWTEDKLDEFRKTLTNTIQSIFV